MKSTPSTIRPGEQSKEESFEELKIMIHGKLVDKLDLTRVGELEGDRLRREIRLVVEQLGHILWLDRQLIADAPSEIADPPSLLHVHSH